MACSATARCCSPGRGRATPGCSTLSTMTWSSLPAQDARRTYGTELLDPNGSGPSTTVTEIGGFPNEQPARQTTFPAAATSQILDVSTRPAAVDPRARRCRSRARTTTRSGCRTARSSRRRRQRHAERQHLRAPERQARAPGGAVSTRQPSGLDARSRPADRPRLPLHRGAAPRRPRALGGRRQPVRLRQALRGLRPQLGRDLLAALSVPRHAAADRLGPRAPRPTACPSTSRSPGGPAAGARGADPARRVDAQHQPQPAHRAARGPLPPRTG